MGLDGVEVKVVLTMRGSSGGGSEGWALMAVVEKGRWPVNGEEKKIKKRKKERGREKKKVLARECGLMR